MSWQGGHLNQLYTRNSKDLADYVDNNLVGSGKVTRAAIIGLQKGVWASSPGYDLQDADQALLVEAVKNPQSTLATGVKLRGEKYFTVQTTERSIYGKKKADGVVIVKTKQAILVAEYDQPLQAGEATPVVESLADYLIGQNY